MRFITCGSIDDGKSTLIGRLLRESKLLYENQLAALESDSRKIKNFTGIDSPYERPEHPELRIDTTASAAEDATEAVVAHPRSKGVLDAA